MAKRLAFLFFMAALCIIALPVRAQYAPQLNTNGHCQYYPIFSQLNAPACPNAGKYPSPFPSSGAIITNALASPATSNGLSANNTQMVISDPNYNPSIFWAYPGLSYNPQIQTYNYYTGTAGTASAIGMHSTCGVNAHDNPGGGYIGGGYVIYFYCANYSGFPCLSASTPLGAGTGWNCIGFTVGNNIGNGVCNQDITLACSAHVVPGLRLSEVTCGEWGPLGPINQTRVVCAGQNFGPNSNFSMSGGYSMVTLYPTFDNSGNLTNLYTDTACSYGGSISQVDLLNEGSSGYDVSSFCSDFEQPFVGPKSDLFASGGISAVAASSTITFTAPNWKNIAGVGDCGATTYTYNTGSSTPSTEATNFVSGFNASPMHTNGCYTAYVCRVAANSSNSCSTNANCTTGTCVVFTCDLGCVPVDDTGTTSLAGGSGVTINYVAYNTKTAAGNNQFFQYGWGAQAWHGWLYLVMGASDPYYGSQSASAYSGNGFNAAILVAACPFVDPTTGNPQPINGVWTCGDITRFGDHFSFTVSPATASYTATANRLGWMGASPACSPSDCSGTINTYIANGVTSTCSVCLKNIPTANRPSGWVPFFFDGAEKNFPVSPGSGGFTGPMCCPNYGGIFVARSGNFYMAYSCGDTSNTTTNTTSLCWTEWPVTGGPARGGFVARNYLNSQNGAWQNVNIQVTEDTSNSPTQVVVTVSGGEGGTITGCGATGTCAAWYTSTNPSLYENATFSFTKKTLPFTPSGNTPQATCTNAQDQSGNHSILGCYGGATSANGGATSLYFFENGVP